MAIHVALRELAASEDLFVVRVQQDAYGEDALALGEDSGDRVALALLGREIEGTQARPRGRTVRGPRGARRSLRRACWPFRGRGRGAALAQPQGPRQALAPGRSRLSVAARGRARDAERPGVRAECG